MRVPIDDDFTTATIYTMLSHKWKKKKNNKTSTSTEFQEFFFKNKYGNKWLIYDMSRQKQIMEETRQSAIAISVYSHCMCTCNATTNPKKCVIHKTARVPLNDWLNDTKEKLENIFLLHVELRLV